MKCTFLFSSVVFLGGLLTFAYSAPPLKAHGNSQDADVTAINQSAQEFAKAFNGRDAAAIAAMWTANAECREASGVTIIGKANIEKAYSEFFKNNKDVHMDVIVKNVRFPAKDMAVETGLLRFERGHDELPTSTTYEVVHVREDGKWKMALSSESGAGQDRLEDLDWLLGDWATSVKGDPVTLSFARDAQKPVITATFSRTPQVKPAQSGSIRIALDPQTGNIRSWGFEEDGGHSQSLWHNDGKSWILDQTVVMGDGTPAAERIVLQRVGSDAITWRAIDRVVGDTSLPDTTPMRLTRKGAK